MKYANYTTEDFILDEYFQKWVKHPDKESNLFWHNWLDSHPGKREIVGEARQAIQEMIFSEDSPPAGALDEVWQKIQTVNDAYDQQARRQKRTFTWPLHTHWYRAAAVISGIAVVFLLGLYVYRSSAIKHQTAYGQTKKVVLPDGSTVILNANSRLRYKPIWNAYMTREVWLEGEAYFSVVHTKNRRKFLVHTSEDCQIEVLGTEFNVYQRRKNTRVVLNKGKVQLNIQQEKRQEQIQMKPGELVELSQSSDKYVRKLVNPEFFSSWTQKELVFSETPVSEIITLLEENYGLEVEITNESILHRKISGSVPSDSLQSLLFVLSESLNYQVVQQQNKIIFRERSAD